MQKLKKYAKKWSYKLCIVFSIVSILCISVFPLYASAEEQSFTTTYLTDFFEYQYNSGNAISFYDVGLDGYPESKFLPYDSFYEGKVSQGDFNYTITGNFKNSFSFDPTRYYTLSFPLSFSTRVINIREDKCSFTLVDRHGNTYPLTRVNSIWPDKIGGDNNYMLTIFYEGTFSGAFLVELASYRLTVGGWNYNSSSSSFVGGILNNRFISITSVSKLEYESVYGDPDIDFDVPSSAPQDELSSIEGDLINKDQLDSVGDFISQNGGNSITNVANGLHAASILFSELFNFNGRKYTIFVDIVQFSLTLGLIGVLLNLAPSVFRGSSRSKSKPSNSKSKGGKDK